MQTAHQKPSNTPLEKLATDELQVPLKDHRSRSGVVARAIPLLIVMFAAAPLAATAHAQVAKPCGASAGPTAHVAGMTFDHFLVYRIATSCGLARRTVHAILHQRLPNSRTPIRTTGPAGWICVAQEVDGHIAIAGHCVQGRAAAISWAGVGLQLR